MQACERRRFFRRDKSIPALTQTQPDFASTAALLGEPARAVVLAELMDAAR